jgi:hypothetical protein
VFSEKFGLVLLDFGHSKPIKAKIDFLIGTKGY